MSSDPLQAEKTEMAQHQRPEFPGANPAGIIGLSDKIGEVLQQVDKVADSETTILVQGETGTGKGLIARAIHGRSFRKRSPFITINCGSIPEHLLESELFGHVRGAFTGAMSSKTGKFQLADGGTLFLDEIGDMSPVLQVKILRFLEEKEFEPVGSCKTIQADVRIIAATHRNLREEVKNGDFREDLFYRIHVIPIHIPPLRQRTSDIPLLIQFFIDRFNKKNRKNVSGVSEEAMGLLTRYHWPGNVRELKNVVERIVIMKEEGEILPSDLPDTIDAENSRFPFSPSDFDISEEGICLNTAVSEFEKALILRSLEKTKWVKNQAAKLLQLNRTTLVEKIKRHHLQ